jgi:hypothetical protein
VSNVVDLDALWHVALLSAGFGVGVVAFYALGVAAVTAPEGGAPVGRLRRAAGAVCFAVCAVVIVIGIWAMLDK